MKNIGLERIIIIILAVSGIFLRIGAVSAYEIVIVQSSNASFYEQAVAGFMATAVESVPKMGPKSARPDTVSKFYLSDRRGSDLLTRRISERGADLILAVGNRALERVKDFSAIPIVHLLAPAAASLRGARSDITGIEMIVGPARQLSVFSEALPGLKTLGLLYDPANSASFVKEARAIAEMHGILMIAEQVTDPKDVPGLLNRFAGGVDAFWMLPDPTVVTPVTVEALLNFSFDNRIPLLTFADKYLEIGALVAVGFELTEMGEQAGRLARKVMASPAEMVGTSEFPEAVKVRFNNRIAAKMELVVNTAALNSAPVAE